MKTKPDKKPFPILLNIFQIYNYTAIVMMAFIAGMFLILPADQLRVFSYQDELPRNKYVVSALAAIYIPIVGAVVYLVRERRKIAGVAFAILTIISYPLNELINHFSNITTSNIELYIYGLIDIALVSYVLFSKRVREVLNR